MTQAEQSTRASGSFRVETDITDLYMIVHVKQTGLYRDFVHMIHVNLKSKDDVE